LVEGSTQKVASGLLLMLAGPIVFLVCWGGSCFLTGAFEPLFVFKQERHAGAFYTVSKPGFNPCALEL
jgi:hypothetical protein